MSKSNSKFYFINNQFYQGFIFVKENFYHKLLSIFDEKDFKIFDNKKDAKEYEKTLQKSSNFVSVKFAKDYKDIIKANLRVAIKQNKKLKSNINWIKNNKLTDIIDFSSDEENIDKKEMQKNDEIEQEQSVETIKNDQPENNNEDKLKIHKQYSDIVIYTDGNLKDKRSLSCFIISDSLSNKKIAKVVENDEGQKSAIQAEFLAILYSLQCLKKQYNKDISNLNIAIVTDSIEALQIINHRQTSHTGLTQEHLNKTYSVVDSFNHLEFHYTKGHSNNYGNILTDGLKYFV